MLCKIFSALVITIICFQCSITQAENWSQWRGAYFNGISHEKNLPITWDSKTNVAWRVSLPGAGGATPVVWGDKIFVTSVDGDDLLLLCFNTSGKKEWQQVIGQGNKIVRKGEGNAASPSPCTDGKHVWAMMSNGLLACYTVDGKKVWGLDLDKKYGPFQIQFGMATSPLLYKDRLCLQLLHGEGDPRTEESRVIALDKLTGKEIWKRKRITGASKENEHSYTSPLAYLFGDKPLMISHGSDFTIAYDFKTGKEIWRMGGLNPHNNPQRKYHPTLRMVASPGIGKNIIVIPTAKNGPVFAVRPGFTGDITNNPKAIIWKRKSNTPDVPTPLVVDGLVYLCRENGNLICIEAETGKELYQKKTHRHRHRASPVYADGHIYLTARDGRITVVKAGRKFQVVATNKMNESITATPVISNGTIYLRTFKGLYAIRKK